MNFQLLDTSYSGHTFRVEVIPDTGEAVVGGVTIHTHTANLYDNGAEKDALTGLTEQNIFDTINNTLEGYKRVLDDISEFEAVLLAQGYTAQADAVINFTATPGATGTGNITLAWNFDGDWTNIIIQKGELADHSDMSGIHSGMLSAPITDTFTPLTHYYFRMKGQITGLPDSEYVYADAIAP